MRYTILWRPKSLTTLERLDQTTSNRIVRAVCRYATTGYGDVKPLKGKPGVWRLRVGDWRVIYRPGKTPEGGDSITVLRVLPRSSAYRE